MESIRAKCRKCGKETKVSDFVVDPVYKMAVCINCSKQRKIDEFKQKNKDNNKEYENEINSPTDILKQKIKANKKAGWDKDDERLERLNEEKYSTLPKVKKISEEKVKYKCPSCKYEFSYNVIKQIPKSCPFCDKKIEKFVLRE
jgi:rubrerythrin